MSNTGSVVSNKIDETAIQDLYKRLINCWNQMDAKGFANLFSEKGNIVGFDGSMANGDKEIYDHLSSIFADHRTARYITIVRETRLLSPGVGLLRAIVGMIPPGHNNIHPKTNAIQSLVAVQENGDVRIAMFQNTPAAFHGRPELVDQLTKELQTELEASAT